MAKNYCEVELMIDKYITLGNSRIVAYYFNL